MEENQYLNSIEKQSSNTSISNMGKQQPVEKKDLKGKRKCIIRSYKNRLKTMNTH
jgi:hypothetical protein